MSADTEPKIPGALYWIGIGIMGILLITLCIVPFALMGLALKGAGILGIHHSEKGKTALPEGATNSSGSYKSLSREPDLSALRVVAEKTASSILPVPEGTPTSSIIQQLQITASPGSLQKVRAMILPILVQGQNHQHYLETKDQNEIQFLMTLKGGEWNSLLDRVAKAVVSEGAATVKRPEPVADGLGTVVAEIVIQGK